MIPKLLLETFSIHPETEKTLVTAGFDPLVKHRLYESDLHDTSNCSPTLHENL
jgi:hypothetical protein